MIDQLPLMLKTSPKQGTLWMPVVEIGTIGDQTVDLVFPENRDLVRVVNNPGARSEFYRFPEKGIYSLLGNAGAMMKLRFGKDVYFGNTQRGHDAPIFENCLDLGSNVNYDKRLQVRFNDQQIKGAIWDTGFELKGSVVRFRMEGLYEEIFQQAYGRHFEYALKLGLVAKDKYKYPLVLDIKRKDSPLQKTLRIFHSLKGVKEVETFRGLINIDNKNNVNYLAQFEVVFSGNESDFFKLHAFDCETDKGRDLFRKIFMDSKFFFYPETGQVEHPRWVFLKGRRRENMHYGKTNIPLMKVTDVLKEGLLASGNNRSKS